MINSTEGWEREVKRCEDIMASRGLELLPIDPDGNCLFRAVGKSLNQEEDHTKFRNNTVEYMEKHRDDFEPFLVQEDEGFSDEYPNHKNVDLYTRHLDRMRQDACWGSQLELQALAKILKVNVLVHQADSPDPIQIDVSDKDAPCVQVIFHPAHHAGAHYDSCIPLNENKNPTLQQALDAHAEAKEKEKIRLLEEEERRKKEEEIARMDALGPKLAAKPKKKKKSAFQKS